MATFVEGMDGWILSGLEGFLLPHMAGLPISHTALAFQPSEYNDWKFSNNPTFLEVLEEFPSLRVPAAFLLSQLPILKPRYYSISSSQDHTPSEVHLTVVTYRTRGETGRLRCSNRCS